jgi:hypothetical protein
MDDTIETHLSDRAVEYADDHIGIDVQVAAIVVPPVPRDMVQEVVDSYSSDVSDEMLRGHLYDLTDLSLAINHAGDPILDHSVVTDEEPYNVTDETVAEIKIARGALISSFNRELAACAERLGLDTEQDDLVHAIRDELEYSVDVEMTEEVVPLDDVEDAISKNSSADEL